MISLIRTVSLVHLRDHRVRTLLTLSGVVLGVALLVAMRIVTQTIFASFTASIESVSGDAVLQMTAGQAGVPEEALERIAGVEGVRSAAGLILARAYLEDHPEERLQVIGVDFLRDRGIRHYEFREEDLEMEEDPLVVIGQPESVFVTEVFAGKFGISLDRRIALITPVGRKEFTVRGVLKVSGPLNAFGGNLLVMDLYAAQLVFERKDRFDQIDIALQPGARLEEVAARLTAEVGSRGQIIRPQMRGRQVEAMLGSLRFGLENSSALAVFLGLFLVYNTMYISVLQRRREIGLLRCVGATRGQISALFVGESLLLGFLGSLLGILVGLWLGRILFSLLRDTLDALIIGVEVGKLSLGGEDLFLALACGLGVSVAATLFPMTMAVRIHPLAALDREAGQGAAPARLRALSWCGLLLILASIGFFLLEVGLENARVGLLSIPFLLLGFSFAIPLFLVKVAPHAAVLWQRVFGVSGRLAADALGRSPLRHAAAVSAVMVGMAAIFVTSVLLHSLLTSFRNHTNQLFKADIVVSAGSLFTGPQNICLSDSLVPEIAGVPGVGQARGFRFLGIVHEGRETFLTGLDLVSSPKHGAYHMVKGDFEEVVRSVEQGREGVMVTNQFARAFGKGMGDVLELVTPSGRKRFPVLGEYMDFVSDTGGITIDRGLYRKYWKDPTVDGIMVYLKPEGNGEQVIREIGKRFGRTHGVMVVSSAEFKEAFLDRVARSFRLTWALKIVLILLAAMGVMNTLMAMVLDRTREIGLLRALGATRAQVQRALLLEAAALGMCGCALGVLLGILGSLRIVKLSLAFLVGWHMEYAVPAAQLALEVAGAVLICIAAGTYPARRAGRLPVLQAISYE